MKSPTLTARMFRIAAQSIGLLLIAGGTAWISAPLAMIVIGTIVFCFAVHASQCAMRTTNR